MCITFVNTLLEQFPGKIDSLLMLFIKILVNELSNKNITKGYRLHVLQLTSYLLIYNAKATFTALQEVNIIIPICQNYFSSLRKFNDTEQLLNLIYGITSIIQLEIDDVPDIIKNGMPKILESLIKLMHKYTKEREREIIERYEDDIADKNISQNELNTKNTVLERLREITEAEEQKQLEDDDNDNEEEDLEDDDYIWSRTDSFYYKSPLQKLEAPLFFRNVLQEMKEQRNSIYSQYIAVISEDNMSLLENIIERCEFLQSLQ